MKPSRNMPKGEEDLMQNILDSLEIEQVLKFSPTDELENFDLKPTRQFLAKKLTRSRPSTDCAEQSSSVRARKRASRTPPAVKGIFKKPPGQKD